ncbi:MAG: restriction endonuclease subunit S [Azonexus sp.]|nr:restriction endonuclease subunit S [Azonexus sp.]
MAAVETLVTDHLDLWTSATKRKSSAGRGSSSKVELYGIKKLRELILELAVRGQLVSQDPNDEPANELLKKIAAEKANLVKAGRIKLGKPLPPITPKQRPAQLPDGWATVRFGDLVTISTGKLDANAAVENGEYLFFTCSQTPSRIDRFAFDTAAVLLAGNGDFNVKYYEGKFEAYQRTYVIEPISWDLKFCFILVSSQIGEITKNNRGSAVKYLKLGDLTDPIFILPPLAEQHRIVAKVDELMSLCDQLEQQTDASLGAHQTLVETLLSALTSAADHAQFASAWQRIAGHFDTLFTTEESIDQLKQTILQLAVMGKLVPQDPNDEPASELLKKIAAEKAKLVKEGMIKKDKRLPEIAKMEVPFGLPRSWECVGLQTISVVGTGATPARDNNAYYNPPEFSWVTSGETSQQFVSETREKISAKAVAETNVTIYPPGTLIVAMYGQGKTRGQITELLIPAGTNQACAAIQLIEQASAHRSYIKIFFQKAYEDIRSLAEGGAQPNLNVGKISETVLPLPPLSEQHRIVAKVDELMALCDQLKSHLSDGQTTQLHLADALVEQAIG